MPLGEIVKEPLSQRLLKEYAPDVLEQSTFNNVFGYTINEIISISSDSEPLFQIIVDALNKETKNKI